MKIFPELSFFYEFIQHSQGVARTGMIIQIDPVGKRISREFLLIVQRTFRETKGQEGYGQNNEQIYNRAIVFAF